MVSKASEDFPLPERPVMTVIAPRGISTEIFFRLWVRAPFTRSQSLPCLCLCVSFAEGFFMRCVYFSCMAGHARCLPVAGQGRAGYSILCKKLKSTVQPNGL